jgi:hypothetical protein
MEIDGTLSCLRSVCCSCLMVVLDSACLSLPQAAPAKPEPELKHRGEGALETSLKSVSAAPPPPPSSAASAPAGRRGPSIGGGVPSSFEAASKSSSVSFAPAPSVSKAARPLDRFSSISLCFIGTALLIEISGWSCCRERMEAGFWIRPSLKRWSLFVLSLSHTHTHFLSSK